jgi:hypothetical protein
MKTKITDTRWYNWLYEEASLKKSGSSLLNSARKQWCQCVGNINIKFKCISFQQLCFKFSWRIKVLYQRVSVIFVFIKNILIKHSTFNDVVNLKKKNMIKYYHKKSLKIPKRIRVFMWSSYIPVRVMHVITFLLLLVVRHHQPLRSRDSHSKMVTDSGRLQILKEEMLVCFVTLIPISIFLRHFKRLITKCKHFLISISIYSFYGKLLLYN